VDKKCIDKYGVVLEKGREKGKSGAKDKGAEKGKGSPSKEVDETPSCSVAVSFAKLYAGEQVSLSFH